MRTFIAVTATILFVAVTPGLVVLAVPKANAAEPTITNVQPGEEAYVHCVAPSVATAHQMAPELVAVRCDVPGAPTQTPVPVVVPTLRVPPTTEPHVHGATTEGPTTNSSPNECRRDRHNNCKD